jgi:hypothetical protein
MVGPSRLSVGRAEMQPPRAPKKAEFESRVEEVPRPVAQPHELLLLTQLAAGAVTPLAERAPSRCRWAIAQRWAGPVLILCAAAPLAPARLAPHHVPGEGRRGRRRLVSAIVDELGEELRSAACHLNLGVLGRAVLSRPAGLESYVGVAWRWETRSRVGVG